MINRDKNKFNELVGEVLFLANRHLWTLLYSAGMCIILVIVGAVVKDGVVRPASADSRKMAVSSSYSEKSSEKTITVVPIEKGDTVWDIAEEYFDRTNHDDLRDFVKEILKTNGLSSHTYIQPGGNLIVPINAPN